MNAQECIPALVFEALVVKLDRDQYTGHCGGYPCWGKPKDTLEVEGFKLLALRDPHSLVTPPGTVFHPDSVSIGGKTYTLQDPPPPRKWALVPLEALDQAQEMLKSLAAERNVLEGLLLEADSPKEVDIPKAFNGCDAT